MKKDRFIHIWRMNRKKARMTGFSIVFVMLMFEEATLFPDAWKAYVLKYYGSDTTGQVVSVYKSNRSGTSDGVHYHVWIGGERIDCREFVMHKYRSVGESLPFKYLPKYHKICMPTDSVLGRTLPDPAK